jgi:hypothetical protein
MSSLLVQIIFGWPAIILSLTVSGTGIIKKWPGFLVGGGVLCAPFSLYLSGYPVVRFLAFLLPLFQFGAAWAVHLNRTKLAWVLLLPLVFVSLLLASIVLIQSVG